MSITATSSATGNSCMTLGPFDVPGGTYLFELFVPYITKGTTNIDVELFEGATLLTTLTGHLAASVVSPGTYVVKLSLAKGSHTLTVKAFVDGGTGKFGANAGTTGNAPNALATLQPA